MERIVIKNVLNPKSKTTKPILSESLKKVQDIIRAAKEGKFTEEGEHIVILGEKLSPEEAVLTYRGKEGQLVASERGVVLSLDTTVTEELEREGLARDVIRAIQSFRKEKGLKVSDRVTLEGGKGLEEVLKHHQPLIEKETNGNFGKLQERLLHIKVELSDGKVNVSTKMAA